MRHTKQNIDYFDDTKAFFALTSLRGPTEWAGTWPPSLVRVNLICMHWVEYTLFAFAIQVLYAID